MADRNASQAGISSIENASGEQAVTHPATGKAVNALDWNDYSLSSPVMRQALQKQSSGRLAGTNSTIVVENRVSSPAPQTEVGRATNNGRSKAAANTPVILAGELHDLNKTVDPCSKKITIEMLPQYMPKAMDRVQDKDPALYARIKDKVKDPRYIGQVGDITEATHDKKGRVNGCVFIQNTPYWESGPAAQSILDGNADLAPKGKAIEADTLNAAGRTLGQEEAIAWRNTGVHAKPGKSNHGFGRAIDLKTRPDGELQPWKDPEIREAMHAHGWRQGDSHGPIKNDLHHWSWAGPGRATEGHEDRPPKRHRRHHR
jgi:hypothetical protein